MITQIEIDGFKTFKDFKVELAPFQVIVGANGSGKSNLFDALQLLGRLASHDLSEAFQGLRGTARELFTKLPDGTTIPKMRLAVDLLLNRHVKDDAGRQVELPYTRLRYTIEIAYEIDELGPDKIRVLSEELKTIPRKDDTWIQRYSIPADLLPDIPDAEEIFFINTGKYQELIDAQSFWPVDIPLIFVRRSDQVSAKPLLYVARDLPRTALNLTVGTEYVAISVVREEMRTWRLIHLNPDELRIPSAASGARFLSASGRNLPTMLAYMQSEDTFALDRVSSDLAYMVPDVYKVTVQKNAARDTYDLWIETTDHRVFSANVLSDGTLRLLALAAIKNDLKISGVLCLEEPENGVNPLNLEKMAHLLRLLVTDFSDKEHNTEPLTQIIVTTHSPLMVSQPDVQDALLFAYTADYISPASDKNISFPVTLMVPVIIADQAVASPYDGQVSQKAYTIDQVIQYMASSTLNAARDHLEKARETLHER